MRTRSLVIGLLLLAIGSGAAAQGTAGQQPASGQSTSGQQQQQPPPEPPQEPPVYTEAVIVSASKVEQQIVNAPATVSVITSDTIESTPANNFAELLKSVPGMNITQTSVRDYNLNMRGATSTLSTSQLAVLDGRSLYLDFFGFIAWDLVPVNAFELKQIEVIRGPASAVWGANALSGVVNFISKTPRELNANNLTINFGGMNRSPDGGQQLDTGTLYSINVTHARPVNDRWAYKLSAGYLSSDPFSRPVGEIPNGTGTQYPPFSNSGTSQPKFTGRVDYDAPAGAYKLVFEGGYSGTDGIIHTGIGPFDMTGVGLGYGTVRYTKGAFKANFFTNILNGDAIALLAVGPDGNPIPFKFDTQTYDVELGHAKALGTRQVFTYGGNLRRNNFDLSIAPLGNSRTEVGGYVQDEIFLNNQFRLNLGARVDKFANIDNAVFSPRVAFIFKPQPDQAIRALVQPRVPCPVAHQQLPRRPPSSTRWISGASTRSSPGGSTTSRLRRSATRTSCRRPPTRWSWPIPVSSTNGPPSRSPSTTRKTPTKSSSPRPARYRATNPPPGWTTALAPLPPATALGVLEVLPPPCPSLTEPCTTGGLPSEFSYRNLGEVINKGIELGVDGAVSQSLNVFANYSWQADPDPDFDESESQLPAEQSRQPRVQLQPRQLARQRVFLVGRRCVLAGCPGRPLFRSDQGVLAGQRRVRRQVGRREGNHLDQGH